MWTRGHFFFRFAFFANRRAAFLLLDPVDNFQVFIRRLDGEAARLQVVAQIAR